MSRGRCRCHNLRGQRSNGRRHHERDTHRRGELGVLYNRYIAHEHDTKGEDGVGGQVNVGPHGREEVEILGMLLLVDHTIVVLIGDSDRVLVIIDVIRDIGIEFGFGQVVPLLVVLDKVVLVLAEHVTAVLFGEKRVHNGGHVDARVYIVIVDVHEDHKVKVE